MKPSIKKKQLRHQAVYEGDLYMDRQVNVIQTVAYRARTDRHTDRQKHRETEK